MKGRSITAHHRVNPHQHWLSEESQPVVAAGLRKRGDSGAGTGVESVVLVGRMRVTHFWGAITMQRSETKCKECQGRIVKSRPWQICCSNECRFLWNNRQRKLALDFYKASGRKAT